MNYQPLYVTLFNALTDAVEALEQNEPERARLLLIRAQQQSEELYMQQEETDGQL